MQLTINNQLFTFIPLTVFRNQWQLPPEFNLAYFEPKDWHGLGSLEGSGQALLWVRQRVLEAVPPLITLADLMPQIQMLTDSFQQKLAAINAQIGLRQVEVEFAVAGFADIMQSVAYSLIQLSHTYRHDPAQIKSRFDFAAIYQSWLDASTRLAVTPRRYVYQNTQFEVFVIYNAYGRVGLKVEVANQVYYVADPALACPAASYMQDLCSAVAEALCRALHI